MRRARGLVRPVRKEAQARHNLGGLLGAGVMRGDLTMVRRGPVRSAQESRLDAYTNLSGVQPIPQRTLQCTVCSVTRPAEGILPGLTGARVEMARQANPAVRGWAETRSLETLPAERRLAGSPYH